MSAGSVLRPTDVEHHAQLGIPTELLDAAGVVRVTDAEARVLLSGIPAIWLASSIPTATRPPVRA